MLFMKIIISPAKSLNFHKSLPTLDFSLPSFLNESKLINDVLRTKNPKHLKDLMKISDKIAELNWSRNINFNTPFNSIMLGLQYLRLTEMFILGLMLLH